MLFTALTVAAGVRLYGLGDEDFWLDEIHTLTATAGNREVFEAVPHATILPEVTRFTDMQPDTGPADVWRTMTVDSHPPSYFIIHQAWRRLAGDGEYRARFPAALFSVLAILPIVLILREYGQHRAALIAAFLLALSYAHIHMAQQARPYSLGMLLVGLSFWTLTKMQARGATRGWLNLGIWGAAHALVTYGALLTHYFAVLPLLGQAVYVALRLRRRTLGAWGVSVFIVGVAYVLTWGPSVRAQLQFTSAHAWLLEQDGHHVWRTLLRAADLPVRLTLMHEDFAISEARSLAGVLILGVALILLFHRRMKGAAVFAAWYFAALATLVMIDLAANRQTLTHTRYISVLAPGLIGMLSLAILGLGRSLRVVVIGAVLFGVATTLQLPTQSNPQNRFAVREIVSRLQPSTLLVFDASGWQPFWVSQMYHNVAYYLRESLLEPLPPVVLLREEPDEELRQGMAAFDRLVVVSPRVDAIPNPLPSTHGPVDRSPYVPQIGFVYAFDRQ